MGHALIRHRPYTGVTQQGFYLIHGGRVALVGGADIGKNQFLQLRQGGDKFLR